MDEKYTRRILGDLLDSEFLLARFQAQCNSSLTVVKPPMGDATVTLKMKKEGLSLLRRVVVSRHDACLNGQEAAWNSAIDTLVRSCKPHSFAFDPRIGTRASMYNPNSGFPRIPIFDNDAPVDIWLRTIHKNPDQAPRCPVCGNLIDTSGIWIISSLGWGHEDCFTAITSE